MSIQGTSIAILQKYYPKKNGTDVINETLGDKHWLSKTNDPNTCALRLSLAFNYGGLPISRVSGVDMTKGKDEKWYIYRADDFVSYCQHKWTNPDVVAESGKEAELREMISGHPGVLFFRLRKETKTGKLIDQSLFGHADIWDGASVWYNPILHEAWQIQLWKVAAPTSKKGG